MYLLIDEVMKEDWYRGRYRVLPRDEIARTLDDPAEINEEITTLIAALVA